MTDTGAPPFGHQLRQHRLAAGLSQAALAERAGLSENAVAALERGRRTRPHPDTVALLADALGLEAEDRQRLFSVLKHGQAAAPTEPACPEPSGTPADVAPVYQPGPAAPPTELIERERAEVEIVRLLESGARLVTLLGPGGVGKTRLAQQLARRACGTYARGVVFVDFSAVRDVSLVAPTILRALHAAGITASGADGSGDPLLSALCDKHLLLILDNFEQILDAAWLPASLIAGSPRLAILVTSRVALRVRGEQQYPVAPLSVPPADWSSLDDLARYGAVQLFVARARAVDPRFALDESNAAAVADICCRLDGLPLAIELAAARIRLLPPVALAARLQHRLSTLTHGPRDLPARQQTMRAALDWSYELLPGEEQHLFARLGVFVGTCDFDAVEAICNPDGRLDILGALQTLVESSLIVQTLAEETPRFGLLETIREYAWERVVEAGEADDLRRTHAAYYVRQVGSDAGAFWKDQKGWLDRWEREHDNLRGALIWARESGDVETGLRLAAGLWRFWLLRGYLAEGMAWLTELILQGHMVDPAVRAEAVRGASVISSQQGDGETATRWCELGLELYRSLGHTQGTADTLTTLGNLARGKPDFPRAVALYEEALALYRSIDDTIGVAVCLNNLGTTARLQGDLERAVALYEESLELRRRAGDDSGIAYTLNNLGDLGLARHDHESGRSYYGQALDLCRELGDKPGSARALVGLGDVARDAGDVAEAACSYQSALTLSHMCEDYWRMAGAVCGLCALARTRGEPADGARLAAALVTASAPGLITATQPPALGAELAALKEALGEARFTLAWHEGQTLPLDAAADALGKSLAINDSMAVKQ